MKGWYGHRHKHSLASRGILTKDMKDIIQYPEVVNYNDLEEVIIAFWLANIKNDYSNFDFDKAFKNIKEELIQYIEQVHTTWSSIEDIENTLKAREIKNIDYFPKTYELMEYVWEIEDRKSNQIEDIILMDKIIDFQHNRGSIFMDEHDESFVNIEKMREKFDGTYRRIR